MTKCIEKNFKLQFRTFLRAFEPGKLTQEDDETLTHLTEHFLPMLLIVFPTKKLFFPAVVLRAEKTAVAASAARARPLKLKEEGAALYNS